MPTFTVRREVAAPADRVWRRLTDWPAQGRWVPLTSVRTTSERPDGTGAQFVGRTGLGPVGFDDPMVVTEWRPPAGGTSGRCRVHKVGPVMLGDAEFEVAPLGPDRCAVTWTEDVEVAGVRRLPGSGVCTRLVGAAVFGTLVRRMAREVERDAGARGGAA